MSDAQRWLAEYGDSHRQIAAPVIYWPAVVILVVGTAGMLWSLPVPAEFVRISPLLNWGSAFLMVAAVYYFIISVPLAIGMLPFMLGVTTILHWLTASRLPAAGVSAGLTAVAVAGLWLGRYSNGFPHAVFRDIQLMMIGPIWLLSNLYRRLGIPY
jgi:hypothetical protein